MEHATSIRDGRTGERLTWPKLLDALAQVDVVFLGETHNDETTHRVELAVYDGLLARKSNRVVLALEMFERDVQPTVDAYLRGELSESEFLARARPWGNYETAYRPLIERAKEAGGPVVASNFPRPLRMRMAREGNEVLGALEGEAQREAPRKLHPNSAAYWRRVDNAVRGHQGMMGGQDDDPQRLYSTQTLWDNAMGEACADALDRFPDHAVVHVNGGFHSAYWEGTVRQLKLRKPEATVKTVSLVPISNPEAGRLVGAPEADYVIFVEARATDLNDGEWSVYVPNEIKYQLRLPEQANREHPVPLLIWLNDDGFTLQDGLDLWSDRLGNEAAIVVIQPPYRELQADLSTGGRWFWPDSFSSDVSELLEAIERTWGYVARHYPIDPQRVCVAGEGTGATLAAATGLLTDRMDVAAIAIEPRLYAKMKDFSLPLPELWGEDQPPRRSVQVVAGQRDAAWWAPELAAYREVGIEADLLPREPQVWDQELQVENCIRRGLGLSERQVAAGTRRQYLLVDTESPRGRLWARLQALWASEDSEARVAAVTRVPEDAEAERISTELDPRRLSRSTELPKCPGPFGGTTVLVLPDSLPEQAREQWLALEAQDPIARQSRFHRLRIAETDGDRSLDKVLDKLLSEGRKNVLIIPAEFCAGGDRMRQLQRSTRPFEDQMTLQFQPGLGGVRWDL